MSGIVGLGTHSVSVQIVPSAPVSSLSLVQGFGGGRTSGTASSRSADMDNDEGSETKNGECIPDAGGSTLLYTCVKVMTTVGSIVDSLRVRDTCWSRRSAQS